MISGLMLTSGATFCPLWPHLLFHQLPPPRPGPSQLASSRVVTMTKPSLASLVATGKKISCDDHLLSDDQLLFQHGSDRLYRSISDLCRAPHMCAGCHNIGSAAGGPQKLTNEQQPLKNATTMAKVSPAETLQIFQKCLPNGLMEPHRDLPRSGYELLLAHQAAGLARDSALLNRRSTGDGRSS